MITPRERRNRSLFTFDDGYNEHMIFYDRKRDMLVHRSATIDTQTMANLPGEAMVELLEHLRAFIDERARRTQAVGLPPDYREATDADVGKIVELSNDGYKWFARRLDRTKNPETALSFTEIRFFTRIRDTQDFKGWRFARVLDAPQAAAAS